jgi:hypothetical protein
MAAMQHIAMKHKAVRALGIALSLIAFAIGGSQQGGLNLMVDQIRAIGTRQWLELMAGSIVASTPSIAPLTERVARSLAGRIALAATAKVGAGKPV